MEAGLESVGVPVERSPRLVRGLDYYLRTVFEVVSPELGEDTVICGGGRYDRLIADLGGSEVPGIGFAIGEDRLIEVLPEEFRTRVLDRPTVAIVPVGDGVTGPALGLARDLVAVGVGVRTEVSGRSLKAGLKWAAKIDAAVAVIVGESELETGTAIVRHLGTGEQSTVPLVEIPRRVLELVSVDPGR